MAGEIEFTVVGNLTADPELKFTPGGHAVANFTVASTPRLYDRATGEWRDGEAVFLRCSAWRGLGENIAASLTKGTRVVVSGALRVRNFDREDGSKGTSVELLVSDIGPSLAYAVAIPTKISRVSGAHSAAS